MGESMSLSIRSAYLLMILIVASCNYFVQFPINDWLTYGSFTYPFSFLITEITNCLHGPKIARKVVYVGFFLAVILSILIATPKIAIASGLAFLISQLLDISVFNKLRQNKWWYAPLFASVSASFIDTFIFWNLAFYGEPLPYIQWACSDFAIKLLCDFCLLVPFRLAIRKNLSPVQT
jgi:queuosine precursor transporter